MRWATVVCLLLPTLAEAGIEDWRVNEVVPSDDGDATLRFIELYVPPSKLVDNCLFPTSRIEIFRADGTLLDAVPPVTTTRCFAGDTYYLFATVEAAAHFGVPRDATLTAALPASAGQVCFSSSATRYDCTRWGVITDVVADLYDPADATAGPAIPDGQALARRSDTGIVADDFVLQDPTPRQPNDGTTWIPPDAGPPDAAVPIPDAAEYDAHEFADARMSPAPDARMQDPNWLLADPGGGATCSCRVGRARAAQPSWLVLLIMALAARHLRRRSSRGRFGPTWG